MKIKHFAIEEWMNKYENDALYNLGETCVAPMSINDLLKMLNPKEAEDFMNHLLDTKLTYGEIYGLKVFRENIAQLYHNINPEQVITSHGAIGANSLVLESLVEAGDEVIVVTPTYQQLQSIPESIGAKVKLLTLEKKDNYLPNLEVLKSLISSKTKVIVINNPNNPSGALMTKEKLLEIIEAAKSVGAYILCDEVYRYLNQESAYPVSITDLYDKGISTSSMSKVFSMAGLRLGWIATQDKDLFVNLLSHRDYQTISAGVINEIVAAKNLEHAKEIIARNTQIIINNKKVVKEWLENNPHFSWIEPQAGTTALIYYDYGISSESFADRLMQDYKTLVVPGKAFDIEYSFRLGYAFETEKLKKGLENITKFAKDNFSVR